MMTRTCGRGAYTDLPPAHGGGAARICDAVRPPWRRIASCVWRGNFCPGCGRYDLVDSPWFLTPDEPLMSGRAVRVAGMTATSGRNCRPLSALAGPQFRLAGRNQLEWRFGLARAARLPLGLRQFRCA